MARARTIDARLSGIVAQGPVSTNVDLTPTRRHNIDTFDDELAGGGGDGESFKYHPRKERCSSPFAPTNRHHASSRLMAILPIELRPSSMAMPSAARAKGRTREGQGRSAPEHR
jgi:hypothetical protein